MQLNSRTITLDGNVVVVSEENWDIAIRLQIAIEKHEKEPLADPRQEHFAINFYDAMAACTRGNMPTLERALAMLESVPLEIDNWYASVVDVNPQWYRADFSPYPQTSLVQLRDGRALVITEIKLPSALMTLYDLEQQSYIAPDTDVARQVFRQAFYPKLAAGTVGRPPALEEAIDWPTTEIDAWYAGVKRLNPGMFAPFDALVAAAQNDLEAQKKKGKMRHRKSSTG